jgi:hypothetical protein
VQLGQVREQGVEVVARGPLRRPGPDGHLVVGDRCGSRRQAAVPVVLALHPQRGEVPGQRLDLAQEVLGGEAPLAERAGQRVGGGSDADPGVDQLPEQGRDQDRVAGVVQLELVDGQQPVPAQRLDGRAEPQRTDQVGQLDERAVRPRLWRLVPQGGQQVGLADAVPAVQVDARPALRRAGPAEQPLARWGEGAGEALQRPDGLRLRRVGGVRQVRAKRASSKRGGGTSAATSEPTGTTGARSTRRRAGTAGEPTAGSGPFDVALGGLPDLGVLVGADHLALLGARAGGAAVGGAGASSPGENWSAVLPVALRPAPLSAGSGVPPEVEPSEEPVSASGVCCVMPLSRHGTSVRTRHRARRCAVTAMASSRAGGSRGDQAA